jgi:hypothetical protein
MVDLEEQEVVDRAAGLVAVGARVRVPEAFVQGPAGGVVRADQERGVVGGDGLQECGVEAGADALGLAGGGDGELAQAHEAARADVFGISGSSSPYMKPDGFAVLGVTAAVALVVDCLVGRVRP